MEEKRNTSFSDIAVFFLPLSLTSLIIVFSHSVIDAGVARTANPSLGLAAYALAKALVLMIENPMFMVRQTVVSLVNDQHSYKLVCRFVYSMAALFTVALALLAYTPAGYHMLRTVFGATEEIARESHLSLKVLFLLPITAAIRNVYHGVAIKARQTLLVPISTFIRLAIMSGIVFYLALFTELPGVLSASFAFVGAFFTEALVMRWRASKMLKNFALFPAKASGQPLNRLHLSRFFLPLTITTTVATAFAPMVNAGIARTLDPEIYLAAYAVGHNLSMLVLAPLAMLHQCTLMFTEPGQPKLYQTTARFTALFTVTLALVLTGVSFSSVGPSVLTKVIGVTPAIAESAILVLQIMCIMALLVGWREYLWGILMQQRRTKAIGAGKVVNLILVVVALPSLLVWSQLNPAAIGALAIVMGEAGDCVYLQIYCRRFAFSQTKKETSGV